LQESYSTRNLLFRCKCREGSQFVVEYKRRYGQVPDAFAALAFDAASVLIDAIGRANSTDPGKVRDALVETQEYPGVTGTITIDADRNVVKGGRSTD
jgi:branched-chain amino acid transport system substrate-binding protein